MPWHIEKQQDEFCVVKDSDGTTVACHPTRTAAEKQLAALYANEPAARENRSAALDAEIRGRTMHGYAAVYDTPWNDRLIEEMGYVERVARGAFRKALSRSGNVPLLWQHERRDVLATTKAGTLRLKEDGRGLKVEADLPNTTLGNDLREMIARGDVAGMSYGIATSRDDSAIDWRTQPPTRLVKNAQRLLDVTLTYEPAYESTEVELRTMGFAALPLQELDDGPEGQIADAETGTPSLEAARLFIRQAHMRLDILEQGGILE